MKPLDVIAAEASACTRCALSGGRTQAVFSRGDPSSDLMFVGEAPGAEEDRQGLPFVGRSGQLLDRLVAEEMGLERDQFYVCNTVKCRPPGNRDPKPDEIASCRPFLDAQVETVKPKVIVTLGRFAAQVLLETTRGVNQLRGRLHPFGDAWLVPTFHPAAVLRGGAAPMTQMRSDLVRAKLVLEGKLGERPQAASVAEVAPLFGAR